MQAGITKREKDFSEWYLDIVREADMAESSAVRGCMIIKPYGYSIWKNIQKILGEKIEETGHEDAYFPLFIPKSFFTKEAEHIKGFAKECAVVTHHRLKVVDDDLVVDEDAKLTEELIIRPTSETVIYNTFSKWISSYRDLPLLINQWANVVRWEMRTRPFLRTTEFLWQEGHTAHATLKEAEDEALKMIKVYKDFVQDYLAISVVDGQKSESEKFAGALNTYTIEAMMQDGKALQSGTSHNLSDNFAKAFNVQFTDKDGSLKYVYQTSWGLSTRIIGALIMVHSDDKGLIIPPKIAPIQVIIVPFWKSDEEKKLVLEKIDGVVNELKSQSVRVKADLRDNLTAGAKMFEWEKKGVPLRIEIGPRDLKNDSFVITRRDSNLKESYKFTRLIKKTIDILDLIQASLFDKSQKYREDKTLIVNTFSDFQERIESGNFVLAHWCKDEKCETTIKEKTNATIRCIPFLQKEETGKCIFCNNTSNKRVIFAKAY